MEALSCNELMNFIVYDTISATPGAPRHHQDQASCGGGSQEINRNCLVKVEGIRKKRKRKARICKNKEEAESQRMTHIAVERNRRKQMNEHLAVLRSLMPPSYVQRGDQASIVGGAIEFVKELEHHLQSIEAQKMKLVQQGVLVRSNMLAAPFSEFFVYPQYTWSQIPNKYRNNTISLKDETSIADIEVTLVETHANLRILSTKSFRQLSNLVSAFQSLSLSILHLNVTTLHPLVLYSISAKVEEGCQLTSVDDIANAVHHMLRIIQDEAASIHNI